MRYCTGKLAFCLVMEVRVRVRVRMFLFFVGKTNADVKISLLSLLFCEQS